MQSASGKIFKILVEYCGSCGHGRYLKNLQKAVQTKYQQAKIEGVVVDGYTGCFEVKVFPDPKNTEGYLIHSKLNGDGGIDHLNIDKVMAKIDKVVQEKCALFNGLSIDQSCVKILYRPKSRMKALFESLRLEPENTDLRSI